MSKQAGHPIYCYKIFRRNRSRYYLIPNDRNSMLQAIKNLEEQQSKDGILKNIAFQQYKGNKYRNAIYIVEG